MRRLSRLTLLLLPALFAACGNGDQGRASQEELVDYVEVQEGGSVSAPAPPMDPAAGTATGTDEGVAQSGLDPAARAEERRQNAAAPGAQPPSNPAVADSAAPRMIIRTGNAMLQVDDLEPAIARVQQLAQRLGGYVANTSMQTGRVNVHEATLELKIPAARWDQAVAGLRPLGKLEGMTTHTEDVGEEYVDVTARMTNARRLEQRLVELLANRTGRLEDVLAVERELARVRGEIERYEGRLRFLRTRVATSTLTVRLHEPMPVIGGRPGGNPIVEAFRDAWDNFVGFLTALIAMMGWLIPLLALTAAVVWLFRRFMRWRPKKPWPRGGGATGPHVGPHAGSHPGPDPGSHAGPPTGGAAGPGTGTPPQS
jgi:hypothetical protein